MRQGCVRSVGGFFSKYTHSVQAHHRSRWLLLAIALVLLCAPRAHAATGPLVFEGGEAGVQHKPKVHIILWGGKGYWESSEGIANRQTLEGFYPAISGSSWTGILTQYYDYATHPSKYVAVAPTYVSTYNPSASIDYNTVPLIVRDAIKAQQATGAWGPITRDSQYVVVGPLVAAYNTNFLPNACAWHSWSYENSNETGAQFNFTFLFNYKAASVYEKCKMYNSDPLRILTTLASHEFAETVTDPLPTGSSSFKRGWASHDPASGGHTISDVCTGTENVGQAGPGGYYVNPLWDNAQGGCQIGNAGPPFPSPQQPHPIVQASGKINLFWRSAGGALDYSWSQDAGETWSNVTTLTSLGQPLAGQPSAVETSPGKISVFWKSGAEDSGVVECFGDTDEYLREMEYNGSSWSSKIPCIGSKQPIGKLGGPPVAVANSSGTVYVFWRGTDNALWYAKKESGVWSQASVGGSLTSNPSVVRSGPDTLSVFWKSIGGLLYYRSYNETSQSWSSAELVGIVTYMGGYGGPTALSRATGTVEAVWPTLLGMYRARKNGSSWAIEKIASGPAMPNPQFLATAIPTGGGDAQLWYAGVEGQLWSSTYSSGSGSWSSSFVFASSGTSVGTQPQSAITPKGELSVYWMDPEIERAYTAWNKDGWHGPTAVSPMEADAPKATTGVASGVTGSSATLRGTVYAGRTPTNYYFQYGIGSVTEKSTSTEASVSGSFPQEINASIPSLAPDTTYQYRLVAKNKVGESVGETKTFTTGWNLNPIGGDRMAAVSCVSSFDCTAVGYDGTDPSVMRWNGTEWKPEAGQEPEAGAALESELTGVSCTSSSFCMAVGWYKSAAGKYLTWAQRRSGSSWELVATQNKTTSGETFNFLEGVSCLSSSQCVAVGRYLTRTSPGVSEVTKAVGQYSTGGSFTLQELPTVGSSTHSELKGVSCYAPNECTAVGYYTSGPGEWKPLEGQWFGPTGWTAAALPLPAGATYGWLYGISCPVADYCKAAGFYRTGSEWRPLFERRNGPKWTNWEAQNPALPGDVSAGELYGISCAGKDSCVAVGTRNGAFYGSRTFAESWNGSVWTAQYPANSSEVSETGPQRLTGVSCPRRGSCVAVGFFLHKAGGLAGLADHYLAKVPPTVETTAATNVKSAEATLNGTVNPNGAKTTYYFEYGPTTSYGSTTTSSETGAGESAMSVAKTIGGLTQNVTYHFRIVASNGTGEPQVGKDMVFTTDRSWAIQSTANPEGSKLTKLNAVGCVGESPCTAVGEYKNAEGVNKPVGEGWFGAGWELLPMAEGSKATALKGVACVPTGQCHGVGYFRNSSGVDEAVARRWTGSEWQQQTLPLPAGTVASSLNGVSCIAEIGQCTAVGYYEASSKVKKILIERWNGSAWALQTSPEPANTEAAELNGVSCARWKFLSKTYEECVAVGRYTKFGTVEPLSTRWNGTAWGAFALTNPAEAKYAELAAVSCPTPTSILLNCIAVGYSSSLAGDAVLVRKWNGLGWEAQSMANPGGEQPRLNGVSCATPTVCFAVGTHNSGKAVKAFGARWKESIWTLEAMPAPEGALSTVLNGIYCAPSGACAAVGHYENGSGTILSLAERYS